MVQGESLKLVQSGCCSSLDASGAETTRLIKFGRAISDPTRLRMLGMMAAAAKEGRGCCELPDRGVPAEDQDLGICACEFEIPFGMAQSKVSYHLSKLKEAGLVREEKRGKWTFYSLNLDAADGLLGEVGELLGKPVDLREGRRQ